MYLFGVVNRHHHSFIVRRVPIMQVIACVVVVGPQGSEFFCLGKRKVLKVIARAVHKAQFGVLRKVERLELVVADE